MSLKLDRMLDDLQRTISTASVSAAVGDAISSRRVFSESRSLSQQNGVNHHEHHQEHPAEHPVTSIRGRSHSGHRSIQRGDSEVNFISMFSVYVSLSLSLSLSLLLFPFPHLSLSLSYFSFSVLFCLSCLFSCGIYLPVDDFLSKVDCWWNASFRPEYWYSLSLSLLILESNLVVDWILFIVP